MKVMRKQLLDRIWYSTTFFRASVNSKNIFNGTFYVGVTKANHNWCLAKWLNCLITDTYFHSLPSTPWTIYILRSKTAELVKWMPLSWWLYVFPILGVNWLFGVLVPYFMSSQCKKYWNSCHDLAYSPNFPFTLESLDKILFILTSHKPLEILPSILGKSLIKSVKRMKKL